MDTSKTPIEIACESVGGQARLASLIEVSPGAVNQWIKKIRPIPVERMVAIERATNGRVTRKDLHPDGWRDMWPELAFSEPDSEKVSET